MSVERVELKNGTRRLAGALAAGRAEPLKARLQARCQGLSCRAATPEAPGRARRGIVAAVRRIQPRPPGPNGLREAVGLGAFGSVLGTLRQDLG